MRGGDLHRYLKREVEELKVRPTIKLDLLNALVQIAEAMAYLERKKIVHRDLAARLVPVIDSFVDIIYRFSWRRNVLLGDNGLETVKLSDLGMSRLLSSSYYRKTASYRVPAKWMAPETILESISTHAGKCGRSASLRGSCTPLERSRMRE